MPVPVSFPLSVEARSPHVPGSFAAVLLDADTLAFPTTSLVDLLVACSGGWRLRQLDGQWQQHGPNSDWAPIPEQLVDGRHFHRLHDAWQWELVANRLPEPTVLIPRPRNEQTLPEVPAPVAHIRPVASA